MTSPIVHLDILTTTEILEYCALAIVIYWFVIRKLPGIFQAIIAIILILDIGYVQLITIPKMEQAFSPGQKLLIAQTEMSEAGIIVSMDPYNSSLPSVEIQNRLVVAWIGVHGQAYIKTEVPNCQVFTNTKAEFTKAIAIACNGNPKMRLTYIVSRIQGYPGNYMAIIDNYVSPNLVP